MYVSRVTPTGLAEAASGGSAISDFGCARLLKVGETTQGWSMPDTYRAPEVLMQVPYEHLVDIWSLAIMVSLQPSLHLVRLQLLLTLNEAAGAAGEQEPIYTDRRVASAICYTRGIGTVHRLSWPAAS